MKNHIDLEYQSISSKIILYFKGFSMGAADIIPGVSGGTIAFISGIYEHLIYAISSIKFKEIINLFKKIIYPSTHTNIPYMFLIVLTLGIGSGILSMSRLIPYLMEEYPFYTYSVFFGLIIFSITIPYKKMNHGFQEYLLMLIFAIVVFFITDINPYKSYEVLVKNNDTTEKLKLDDSGKFHIEIKKEVWDSLEIRILKDKKELFLISNLNPNESFNSVKDSNSLFLRIKEKRDYIEIKGNIATETLSNFFHEGIGKYLWIFFVASIAICAMILPGISGAYILVLFGEYQYILKALHDKQLDIIIVFLIGVATGLLSFVRILEYMLEKYHSYTMAALTGFLIGSLNKIYPFKYLENEVHIHEIVIGISLIFLGAIFLFFLEQLSRKVGDPEPPI